MADYDSRTLQRFWSKVDKNGPNGCWLWTGSTNGHGYGSLSISGKHKRTHRISWEIHRGPVPDGMLVCHHCDVRPCVRPDHLFVGTGSDNTRDMDRKGRRPPNPAFGPGEKDPFAKLTTAQAMEIKYSTTKVSELAKRFGVGKQTVRDVRNEWTWRHI